MLSDKGLTLYHTTSTFNDAMEGGFGKQVFLFYQREELQQYLLFRLQILLIWTYPTNLSFGKELILYKTLELCCVCGR